MILWKRLSTVIIVGCFGLMVTACGSKTDVNTTTQATTATQTTATPATEAPQTTAATVTEAEDVKVYGISGGGWFLHGKEDEVSIDMDGLKGFTSYTKEAIPETDGYLVYKGETEDGWPIFDVMDIYGQYFSTITFTSEDQFYMGEDTEQYYVKWDY